MREKVGSEALCLNKIIDDRLRPRNSPSS